MYADAMMNLRPWQLWTADGTPAPDTLELVALLESVLRRRPDHPGANHYYIHAVEASPTPERALASAERLLTLVPAAGHLVHMPSHIYMHTGDFAKMATLNEQAAAVDEAYIAKANPEGVYPFMYYGHNVHFAMFAHMLAGRFAPARAQADKLAALASPHVHEMAAMAEWTLTLSTLIDVRFQKWDRVLAAPAPDATLPLVTAIDHFARATAQARGNRLADARHHAEQFEAARAKVPAETMFVSLNPATAVLEIASVVLKAELAADAASRVPFLREAVAKQDALRYEEPPPWCVSLRESLGVALLQAGARRRCRSGLPRRTATEPWKRAHPLWPDAESGRAGTSRRGAAREARVRRSVEARGRSAHARRAALTNVARSQRLKGHRVEAVEGSQIAGSRGRTAVPRTRSIREQEEHHVSSAHRCGKGLGRCLQRQELGRGHEGGHH